MLPYATNEDVIRICKELIKEGGSQPQPTPTPSIKSYKESCDEILDFFNNLAISGETGELPGGFEETYSLEGATVEDIWYLWESLDSEAAYALMGFMFGQYEDEHGRLECLYNMTVNSQHSENSFFAGHADLHVSIETDAETGDSRVVPAVCVGDITFDYNVPVHGTLTIKFVPAN